MQVSGDQGIKKHMEKRRVTADPASACRSAAPPSARSPVNVEHYNLHDDDFVQPENG